MTILVASMTIIPETMAFVVAMAWTMLPAMPLAANRLCTMSQRGVTQSLDLERKKHRKAVTEKQHKLSDPIIERPCDLACRAWLNPVRLQVVKSIRRETENSFNRSKCTYGRLGFGNRPSNYRILVSYPPKFRRAIMKLGCWMNHCQAIICYFSDRSRKGSRRKGDPLV